jgi:hypothetical protein
MYLVENSVRLVLNAEIDSDKVTLSKRKYRYYNTITNLT